MTHAHDRTLLAKLGFDDPDRRNPLHDAACQYLARPEIAAKVRDHIFGVPPQSSEPSVSVCRIDPYYGSTVSSWITSNVAKEPISDVEVHVCKGHGQYSSTIGFIDVVSRFERTINYSGLLPRPDTKIPPKDSVLFTPDDIHAAIATNSHVFVYEGHAERASGYSEWAIESWDDCAMECKPATDTYRFPDPHYRSILPKVDPSSRRVFAIAGAKIIAPARVVQNEQKPIAYSEAWMETAAIEVKAHQATAGDVLRQVALYRAHHAASAWAVATCYPISKRDADAFASANVKHVQLSPERVKAWAREQDAEVYQAPEV